MLQQRRDDRHHLVGRGDTDVDVHARGMELFGAGTHPFAQWSAQKLTDAPRYAELIKRTQWWGRQMLIWGVHVHVGVSSSYKVMPIISSLLQHY
ncbi:glutamate-cysteine ligase family protein, partial [Mycolicibacter heraklionensis]|uniref:glutamate-cysteine ligase family protein n=1 Tax=Mycolicibacter heraklionensis TaxID=512402 RepID=UPI0037C66679